MEKYYSNMEIWKEESGVAGELKSGGWYQHLNQGAGWYEPFNWKQKQGGAAGSMQQRRNAMVNIIKSLIMMTLIHKIPPNLPLQREALPLFGKEGRGEIFRYPRQFNFETLNMCPLTKSSSNRMPFQPTLMFS